MPGSARLVHAFHAGQACAQTAVWFEYVPTKANPADEPSRDPALWGADFRPATAVRSQPVHVCFPPLSHVQSARAWRMEAERAGAHR